MAKESALARLPFPAKLGIIIVALALFGVAYWVVFYGDIAQKITTAERAETALKDQLGEAKKAQGVYQKDLAELHDREQRKGEIEKILPSQAQYPSFLSSVQSVANISGVTLTAWNPDTEVPEEFYARVPMKLKMKGRFHQIAKYLYAISQLERIINMEDISIQDAVLENDEIIVSCEALATAFRTLSEEATPANTPSRRGIPQ